MKEAIKRAIEGGFKHQSSKSYSHQIATLNPIFWQALGKAEGWPKISAYPRESDNEFETWKMTWHQFIDHLAVGKDADSYFNELLK